MILISNLSKDELPSNDFKVLPIKGLCINGNIDPRCKEIGYVCLMGSNIKQSHFFDWFYENITCPILKNIKQQHNPMSISLGEDEEVPVDQRFTLWGDSDIPYLQQMTSPERIDRSMKRDWYFAKIGANITETSQALDVGTGFKVMKLSSRTISSVGSEEP